MRWQHQPLQEHVHQREHDAAHECRSETSYVKARNEGRGELEHDGIDHEPEQSQGEDREWEGDDL